MSEPDAWVTAAEAAEALGVPARTVRSLIVRHQVPTVWRDGHHPTAARRFLFAQVEEAERADRTTRRKQAASLTF